MIEIIAVASIVPSADHSGSPVPLLVNSSEVNPIANPPINVIPIITEILAPSNNRIKPIKNVSINENKDSLIFMILIIH